MAGILVNGDTQGVEASGVYRGILIESMIDTVSRVKKPFIDVHIPSLFFKDADYPLTYVPMFNMVLPLKKDQEVYVYFNQDNHRYPVLWKLAADVDKDYINKFQLPSGGFFPSAEDTTEVVKFSDSFWFIGTKSYGVFHWGEQCVLLNDDSIIMGAKSKIQMKAGGKVQIVGSSQDLGEILYNVFNTMLTTTLPTVQGSPTSQTFNTEISTALQIVTQKLKAGFID